MSAISFTALLAEPSAGISEIPVAASSIRLRESGFQDRDRVLLEKVTRYVKNRDNDFGERQVEAYWREF
ncbi:hypothetical protein TNCV_95721 [Trichonephila clavipes]|nr:hypothetical protein TNCV_95721 [Trichonephila clavipes]